MHVTYIASQQQTNKGVGEGGGGPQMVKIKNLCFIAYGDSASRFISNALLILPNILEMKREDKIVHGICR
jgi:hypothetical protein